MKFQKIFRLFLLLISGSFLIHQCMNKKEPTPEEIEYMALRDVISFEEMFVAFSNSQNRYFLNIEQYFQNIDAYILERNENQTKKFVPVNAIFTFSGSLKDDNGISEKYGDKRDTIVGYYHKSQNTLYRIKENIKELDLYIRAEDFKDDKSEKYQKLKKEIRENIESTKDVNSRLISLLKPFTLRSYQFLLADKSYKESLLNTYQFIEKSSLFVDEIQNQINENHLNAEKLEEIYTAINSLYEEGNDLENPTSVEEENFNSLNKVLIDRKLEFLGAARKLNRDLKENEVLQEKQIRIIKELYNSLNKEYRDALIKLKV